MNTATHLPSLVSWGELATAQPSCFLPKLPTPRRGLWESCPSPACAPPYVCDLSPTIFSVVWGLVSSQAVGDMHARLKVNAHFFCLAPGLAKHSATLLTEPHRCPVEDGVLGIILEAVADDKVEVLLKIIKVQVAVSLQVLLHGEKVHGLFDVV